MKRLALASALALSLSQSAPVSAHPFGLSSTNRLFAIEPDARGARLAYVLDFAELPTTQELTRLDGDHDGQVTAVEREAYLSALFRTLLAAWQWSVDGRPVTPAVVASNLEVSQGEANLHTLRIVAELRVDRPAQSAPDAPWQIAVRDESYNDRPGWRELRIEDSAQWSATTLEGAADPSIVARRAQGERVTLRMNSARYQLRSTRPAASPAASAPARRAPVGPVVFALALATMIGVFVVRRRRS